jgi:hypothetical protein
MAWNVQTVAVIWPFQSMALEAANGHSSSINTTILLGAGDLFANVICNPEPAPWTETADHPLLGQTATSCSLKPDGCSLTIPPGFD